MHDRIIDKSKKILLGLLVLRLVLMAVIPVFEPSEARYAAISANMARSGDFVVPRFTYDCQYQSFDGKPPLVFQAGGLFCRMLGVGREGQDGRKEQGSPYALQLGVRFFPLLSAALLLLILFHSVRVTADGEAAWLSVFVCATCTAFFAAAGLSMTDMTLTCCVAGALLLYECLIEAERKQQRSGFMYMSGVAALLGAGMLVKGPVALVMFGLPVFVDALVNRRWRIVFSWKWLAVAPIFLLIAVPWFVLIEQRNPGAVWYFFYNENFMRFISHDYGDKYGAGREAFRGVSILWAFVATLPWALVPVWRGLRRLRGLRVERVELTTNNQQPITQRGLRGFKQFDVLAIVAIVGFWCLTSRVLLYYLFPMIPLFAAALAKSEDRRVLKRLVPWCAAATALVVTVAFVSGMFFSDKMQGVRTPFSVTENHYANEFYHGTKPAEEIGRLKAAYEARQAAERAYWMEWRRKRDEEEKKKRAEAAKEPGK